MRTVSALGLLGVALCCSASAARGDVGIERVHPRVAEPGDPIEVELYCGGCPAAGLSFPISLVPAGEAPSPRRCRDGAVCRPSASDPPRREPYRFLGRTDRSLRPRLRAEVPPVPPGGYEVVIFCASCKPGPRGSLISSDEGPNGALRITGAPRSEGSLADETELPWLLLGIVAALLGAGVWVRRAARR